MLEPVGLGVHLVERQPERVGEILLEQAVVAEHLERDLSAGLGQRHAAIGHAHDETVAASFFVIGVTDGCDIPSRSAIALVDAPSGSSCRIALR